MELTLFIGVIVLLGIWLFIRRRAQAKEPPQPAIARKKGNPAYHAVSIRFEANACSAAKEMAGRRFLSSAAPRLPLPGCEVLECRCRFAHHEDRRKGKERRSPFSAARYSDGTGSFKAERRERLDRRKDTDPDGF